MAQAQRLSAEEQRMWRALHRMQQALDRGLERHLADQAGLSSADFDVMVPVSEAPQGRLRARELGRGLGWDRSRLSHHLRRMEHRGLIERRDCPGDARGTVIALTPCGWSLIRSAAPAHAAAVRSYVFDVLTPQQVRTLAELAERITARVARSGTDACVVGDVDACAAAEAGDTCAEAGDACADACAASAAGDACAGDPGC